MNFEEKLYEILKQGSRAQSIDDWDKVIDQLKQLKQKTPKRKDKRQVGDFLARAYNNRGVDYSDLKDYSQSIKDYDIAIRLDPNHAEAYYNLGNAYSSRKEYQKAIKNYNNAIHLDPNFTFSYNGRGNAYLNQGKYTDAIQDYNTAIHLAPNDAGAYYNHGTAYALLKDYKKAIKNYDTAIRLNPTFVIAYNGRGNAYSDLKDYPKAIQDFDEAIRLDPNDANAYNNRGNAYSKLKDYKRAIQDYDTAIRLDPKLAIAYNGRGSTYKNLKKYRLAIKDFDTAIDISPNFVMAYNSRGNAYSDLNSDIKNDIKNDPQVIKDFEKALPFDSDLAKHYNNRDNAYLTQGYTKETIDEFIKKLSENAINDFKKAVSLLKETIDKDSTQESDAKEFILTQKELYLTAQHEEFNNNNDSFFTGKLDVETLKLLLQLWQVVKEIKKGHEIKDHETKDKKTLKLAHYTSLDTVHNLLPGTKHKEKKNKENLFRLYDARGMNDPEEGEILFRRAENLKNFYKEIKQKPNSQVFIASFVKEDSKSQNSSSNSPSEENEEDNLLMWRLYGKDARGAKLTFPIQGSHKSYKHTNNVINHINDDPKKDVENIIEKNKTYNTQKNLHSSSFLPMAIYKVKYEELKEEDKIVEILQLLDLNDSTIREYVPFIIDEIRFLYKNEAYHFEEEYRIVWVISKKDSRVKDSRVKVQGQANNFYMEVESNDFLFNHEDSAVWVGTAVPRKELARDCIKFNLEAMEYENCEVKTSKLKYIPSSK